MVKRRCFSKQKGVGEEQSIASQIVKESDSLMVWQADGL